MTPADWDRVDDLFTKALELPEEERLRFVLEQSGEDEALRSSVERLLEAEAAGDLTVDELAQQAVGGVWDALASDMEQGESDLVGQRLGAFLLTKQIGRGGMGTIYLAERADGEFRRQVAVKVLRRGIDTDDVVGRFRAERQILASLSHPNIARLLDGGSTPDGRPYLVMDYVDGRPLDEYADIERLSVDARLELFDPVAEAVQFAHRHLVIHRDLKPSNILVDGEGRPKLLDFGIAKLLDPGADEWSTPLTRTGAHLLTPEYASPEQLAGEPPTTATDVYQLGLVLYRLLCGRSPWRRGNATGADRQLQTAPRPPSRAVSLDPPTKEGPASGRTEDATTATTVTTVAENRGVPVAGLVKRLEGDLDTIVLKALHPDPARRYASVEHLLEDLRRHRRGLPIEARRDSVSYRAARFVARHRLGVGVAAAILLLLVGYASTVTFQARRIALERDRADLEAAKARQVTDFVVGLFEVSDPTGADGDTVSARTLLDIGARRLEEELAGQPEVRATLLATIGRIYSRLGRYDLALPHVERALREHQEQYGGPHEEVLSDLRELAFLQELEDADLAGATLEEALVVASQVYGEDHPVYASTLSDFGNHLTKVGDAARGQALREEAVQILRDADPVSAGPYLADALVQAAYGSTEDEAVEWMREALSIRARIFGDSSLQVGRTLSDIGLALEARDPAESESSLRRSLSIHRRVLGDDHAETSTILNNLAGVLRDRGDHGAAEPLYREVVERRLAETPPATGVRLAFPLHGLGWTLAELGRHDEAEPMLRDVVRLLDDAGPGLVGVARSTLGRCLALQGRYQEAEPHLLAGYDAAPDYRPLLNRLIDLYEAWERPRAAERYREIAAEVARPQ